MILKLLPVALAVLLFTTGCSDEPNAPRLKIYTMDENLLPIDVIVNGDTAGVLTRTAILTQFAHGDTFPAFGSEGTLSLEVEEGTHTIMAISRPVAVPSDSGDGFSDSFSFGRHEWTLSVTTEIGIEYPCRIRERSSLFKIQHRHDGAGITAP